MKFIQDGSPALRNRFDAAHEITLPYEWNVSGLPKGLYAVIVFAYPEGRSNIIGYRRMDITIKRD